MIGFKVSEKGTVKMKKIFYLLVLLVVVGTSCSDKRTKNEVKGISHRESSDLRGGDGGFLSGQFKISKGDKGLLQENLFAGQFE